MLGREAQGKAMPAKMPPPTGRERKICTNDPSHDPQWSRCLDTLLALEGFFYFTRNGSKLSRETGKRSLEPVQGESASLSTGKSA